MGEYDSRAAGTVDAGYKEAVEQNNQDVMAEEGKILDECVEKYGINPAGTR